MVTYETKKLSMEDIVFDSRMSCENIMFDLKRQYNEGLIPTLRYLSIITGVCSNVGEDNRKIVIDVDKLRVVKCKNGYCLSY